MIALAKSGAGLTYTADLIAARELSAGTLQPAALSSHHRGALSLLSQPEPDAAEVACVHSFPDARALAGEPRRGMTRVLFCGSITRRRGHH
jgi:hypothetical protein